MAYIQKKTFKMSFAEDHEFAGLEVWMFKVSIGKLLKLLPKIEKIDDVMSVGSDQTDIAEFEEAFRELSKMISHWNIEREVEDDDGKPTGVTEPVPATTEGLMDQELKLVLCLFQEWAATLIGVSDPLSKPSSNGEQQELETQLPMASMAS